MLDVTVGPWRYQRQGAHAFAEQYRQDFPVRPVVKTWRERATEWGAVVEVEARLVEQAHETFYRWAHLFTVDEGMIVEDVICCSGGWDEAIRERWRNEAPMVRR